MVTKRCKGKQKLLLVLILIAIGFYNLCYTARFKDVFQYSNQFQYDYLNSEQATNLLLRLTETNKTDYMSILMDNTIRLTGTNKSDSMPRPKNNTHGRKTTKAHLTMYGPHRAEKSFALLPKWLQNYFEWHKEQTRNRSNSTKYIVISCHDSQEHCGGISDRLRPLPFYLLYASLVNRVLCIHWTRPFGLENYLEPPVDKTGRMVDWRCPTDVPLNFATRAPSKKNILFNCHNEKVEYISINCAKKQIQEQKTEQSKYVFLDLQYHTFERMNMANHLFQYHTYADKMPHIYQWQFPPLIGDIFRVMFEPTPELTRRINNTMVTLGLWENEYTSVHVRSRYPVQKRFKSLDLKGGLKLKGFHQRYLPPIINNAIDCANLLEGNNTIYFVSDSHEVVKYATTRDIPLRNGNAVRVIGTHRDEEPLHSEGKHVNQQISDFYPLFEDLLIMGGSKCVAYGMGSFGAFGAGLIGNRCRAMHRLYNGRPLSCPNERTSYPCESKAKHYEGKILFESKDDHEGLISHSTCE